MTLNNIELILLSLSRSSIMRSLPHNVGSRVSGRVECNGMKNLQPFASWFHNNLQQISTELAESARGMFVNLNCNISELSEEL